MTTAARRLRGWIYTPQGSVFGELDFAEQILEIREDSAPKNNTAQFTGETRLILPGFIDVHVHGGGGFDAMDGRDGVLGLASFHARHGTTALLATTITNPFDRVLKALTGIREAMNEQNLANQNYIQVSARVLGAHLEGPFISPSRLGAQPAHTVLPTAERVQSVLESGVVRVTTVAPELEGAFEAIQQFVNAGVRISLGHTVARADMAAQTLAHIRESGGIASGTHLFNAMGGIEGREPGVAGAILADEKAFAEVIFDGHHVHPLSFLTAYRAKSERLMLITDAVRAAGKQDGSYDLGGQAVVLRHGTVRLPDGTLAGSTLTMIEAVQNAVRAGLSLENASRLASLHPAHYLGLEHKGRLEPGMDADIIVLRAKHLGEPHHTELELEAVFVEGQSVELSEQPH